MGLGMMVLCRDELDALEEDAMEARTPPSHPNNALRTLKNGCFVTPDYLRRDRSAPMSPAGPINPLLQPYLPLSY
jgi:hypothetical protein